MTPLGSQGSSGPQGSLDPKGCSGPQVTLYLQESLGPHSSPGPQRFPGPMRCTFFTAYCCIMTGPLTGDKLLIYQGPPQFQH
jgi:hypothetical protein